MPAPPDPAEPAPAAKAGEEPATTGASTTATTGELATTGAASTGTEPATTSASRVAELASVALDPPTAAVAPREVADEPVPKLPRGRGLKLSGAQMIRIALTAAMLVMLILMQKPCSDAVSKLVTDFDDGSASNNMPKPGTVGIPHPREAGVGSAGDYEHLGANMTRAEMEAAIARSRAKNDALKAAGSGSAGSGSAPSP